MTTEIFWCHPKLMDYRQQFFEKMSNKYDIRFFFHETSPHKPRLNSTYGMRNKISSGVPDFIPPQDLRQLTNGIRRADVFISSFLWNTYTMLGILIAKLLHKKIIIWEETHQPTPGRKGAIKNKYFQLVGNFVDAFFVLGEVQKQYLIKFGIDPDKIFVANEYPSQDYSSVGQHSVLLPFSLEKRVVLFMGRFVEMKGITYLLHAFRELQNDTENVALVLVGDGPLKKHLIALGDELSIQNLYFPGWIGDCHQKSYLFNRASMLAMPSIVTSEGEQEGGPLVVLEALSAGTPVVGTTAIGSSAKLIRDGANGYIVPPNNADALHQAMKDVLTRGEITEELVLAEFAQVKGFDFQVEQMQCAIGFVLQQNPSS